MKRQLFFMVILAAISFVSCNAPLNGGFTKKKYLHIGSLRNPKEEPASTNDQESVAAGLQFKEEAGDDFSENVPQELTADLIPDEILEEPATPGMDGNVGSSTDTELPEDQTKPTVVSDNTEIPATDPMIAVRTPDDQSVNILIILMIIFFLIALAGFIFFSVTGGTLYDYFIPLLFLALALILALIAGTASTVNQMEKEKEQKEKEGREPVKTSRKRLGLILVFSGVLLSVVLIIIRMS